jgi:hypothetical protein
MRIRPPRPTNPIAPLPKHGFKGAMINGMTRGVFHDDKWFWPIYECAAALDVPIYIHPTRATPRRMNRSKSTWITSIDLSRRDSGFVLNHPATSAEPRSLTMFCHDTFSSSVGGSCASLDDNRGAMSPTTSAADHKKTLRLYIARPRRSIPRN